MRRLSNLLLPRSRLRRRFPSHALTAIEQAIEASEQKHRAEVRVVIEMALDVRALWRTRTVRDRALEVFAHHAVANTNERNGVLIYVLLAECAVDIVADSGFDGRVTDDEWQRVCTLVEREFARGRCRDGVLLGIEEATALLGARDSRPRGRTSTSSRIGRPCSDHIRARRLRREPLPRHAVAAAVRGRGESHVDPQARFMMLGVLLAAAPFLAAHAETATPQSVGLSSERLQRVHELVERTIAAGEIAGAVTLVARNGQVAYLEAQGVMDLDVEAADAARFDVPPRVDVEARRGRRDPHARRRGQGSAQRSRLALHSGVREPRGRRREAGAAGAGRPPAAAAPAPVPARRRQRSTQCPQRGRSPCSIC